MLEYFYETFIRDDETMKICKNSMYSEVLGICEMLWILLRISTTMVDKRNVLACIL